MKMTQTSTEKLDALVALARAVRPDWDVPGIRNAIRQALARDVQPTIAELAYALIRCAENPTIATPAVVAMDGRHWDRATKEPADVERARKCGRCSEFHLARQPCEPIKPRGKHGVHIAEAREILRDVKAGLCAHRVVPWLCADCKPKPDRTVERARQYADTELPEESA